MQQWSPDGVRQERSGWRCEEISQRHRQWGYNCPAVDLDFVVAEYNHGKPVALVEYKDKRAMPPNLDHATYHALTALADGYVGGPIPFFVATYCSDDWWFLVKPVNAAATKYYAHVADKRISEQRFVRSLYLLRTKVLSIQDEAAIARLNSFAEAQA